MKNLLLVLCILGALNISHSQVQVNDFGRNYTDTLPSAFKLEIPFIRNHVYKGVPDFFKEKERHKRAAFRFSDQSALQVADLLKTGDVYSDWGAFEDYLNRIFDKVVPPEIDDRETVRMYLLKSGSFNAFMTPSGISCVNIGVFNTIEDEATLAGILAHELAHYIMRHSLKGFIKSERGEFRTGVFRKNKSSQFSIANETQADSLAMVWMEQSGYSLDGMVKAFSIMKKDTDKMLARYKDVWERKATTHPLPESRMDHLMSFQGKGDGKDFLVSEKLFNEFREKAKPEILKHLLEGFQYNACIEAAFKFHLQDTDKPAYLYYLMEAIRRSCYMNPENWSKNFINYRYYEEVESKGDERKKEKITEHIFEKFPELVLGFSQEDVKKMPGAFYWEGEVKFTTNEQAFDFFYRVSQLFDEPECVLSNALSITKADDIRAKELEKYLSYKNIKYRSFAENLKSGTISSNLEDKKMVVWSGFQAIVRQGDEDIPIRIEDPNATNSLAGIFDTIMMDFPDYVPVFLPDWNNYRLNDFQILQELEQFSFMQTVSKGQRTELHILDPRYWDALRKFNVNEIQFLNCIYYESRKSQKSKAAYEELIAQDYMDIFNQKKRTKYLELFITAIRSIENGAMKIKFYGGDNKLNFKKQARPQIMEMIKIRLEEMDREAKKTDRRYRKN